ncbi:MAG: substrate-binding domain-containing protein [Actinomycetota bacterium]
MKRRMRVLLPLAAVLIQAMALLPARADEVEMFIQDSKFCDKQIQFKGTSAVADGPYSHLEVHNGVLAPAYARACPSGSGLMTFLGTGERSGIEALLYRNAARHFGTTDVPMSHLELIQADGDLVAPDRRGRNSFVNHVPLFVSAQAVGYNLANCPVPALNVRSQVLSAIYTGLVTRWDDPLIAGDNPGLASCDRDILVAKRADFSGSTLAFKDYLSKRNPQWSYYKQPAQNQNWPTVTNRCPAYGDVAMARCILTTQDSIGYLPFRTAKNYRVNVASLDSVASAVQPDPAARFVRPSAQGCTDAASSSVIPPPIRSQRALFYQTPQVNPTTLDWNSVSLSDAPLGYPMCALAYGLIYQNIQTAYFGQSYSVGAGRTSIDYLWTALKEDAQSRLAVYDYGRLPPNLVDVARAGLETVRYQS